MYLVPRELNAGKSQDWNPSNSQFTSSMSSRYTTSLLRHLGWPPCLEFAFGDNGRWLVLLEHTTVNWAALQAS